MELLTGRTHQIRGQLAAEGCPIFGDFLYGPNVVAGRPNTADQSSQAPTTQHASPLPTDLLPRSSEIVSRSSKVVLRTLDPVQADRERGRGGEGGGGGGGGGRECLEDRDQPCKGSDDGEAFSSPGLGEGGAGVARFVESPKMALQAYDILLELEGDAHTCSLPRSTCWWVSAGRAYE